MNKTMKMMMVATIALSTALSAADANTDETKEEVVQPKKKSELVLLADGCAGKCPKEMIRRNTEEAKKKRAEREAKNAAEEAVEATDQSDAGD